MTPESVAVYLKDHPEFFEEYADMLAEISIPHPHGGRTVSISERQILTLREKSKQLEAKLREMIQFGEENDAIIEKVHRLALALFDTASAEEAADTLRATLVDEFQVPHVALRVWGSELPALSDANTGEGASEATRQFAATLSHPYCGAPIAGVEAWFGEDASRLKSLACVALKIEGQAGGLLVLASEDPQRFYPEMGTLHLRHISELAVAALTRPAQT